MDTLRIVSNNYNGQSAVITYYPDTGGTINLGTQVLPYDYIAPYFYGTYTLFFPAFGSTCTLYVEDESGNFLLQENGDYIFQENFYKIIIETAPSPTPTTSITPSVTPSLTPSVTPTSSVTPSVTPSRTPSVTPTSSVTPSRTPSVTPTSSVTPSRTPSVTPTSSVTPSRTPSVTPTSSVTPSKTPTPTPSRVTFTYYRWQITEAKTTPPNSNCVQVSEFVFQIGGVDQSMAGVTVTNPSGSNPSGEEPSKLVDGSLTTKGLDLNFVTNGNVTNFVFQFSSAKSFTGYRWATANDEEGRDPKSWTIAGSNNGTTWTTLHTVSGFSATSTRNTYQTAQTY